MNRTFKAAVAALVLAVGFAGSVAAGPFEDIVGMIPMTIGGAGEEQNAALAPAVIGGLLFATPTTLLVVYPYPL
jgi:hypothetical protein